MARPAIRALQRPLIEQSASSFNNNAGHILHIPLRRCNDQPIAGKCWTTPSWRELHSASQVYENEAGPSNYKKDTSHDNTQLQNRHRPKNEARVTLLRREVNHTDTRPSAAAELLREVLEAEQVWPLKADGYQPREIVEVLNILRDRQMKEGRWQRLELLQHIEFIHDGIRNCLHRVRQKAKSKIVRESHSSQIQFTEEHVEKDLANQSDVGMWQSLLKLRALRELLSGCRQVPLRIPSVRDNLDVIEAIANDPSVPDRRSKFEKLLQDIERAIPPYKRLESSAATELLEETKMEELAIDWKSINQSQREKGRTFSDIQKAYKDRELSKPLGSVRMFEDVWKVMQTHLIPTSSCYSTALAVEIKLATWRSAKLRKRSQGERDELDQEGRDELELVWKPVTDLLGDLHARRELPIRIINQVMWSTVRHDPNHSFPNFDQHYQETDASSAKFVWPALDSVSAVYDIMRNMLLQRERILAAPQTGSSQQRKKYQKLPARLLGDLLLEDDHIPSSWTYNLMLRFYSSRGDMKSVLQVVQDMDNTTIGANNEYPKISMVTFGYIFDAFAKHGVPSRLVQIDRKAPEKSIWSVDENVGYHDKYGWNMDNLDVFYERFLLLHPAEASQLSHKGSVKDTEATDTHPVTILDRATSLIQEQMAYHADTVALAPSSQQQFFIITALRRVSGDEPEWVISQFVRLAAKFDTIFSESAWDANGSPINDEGWTRFRMTSRIERIMEMLYEMRDSEDDERKGMKWQTKFQEEIKARVIASQDEID
ncbi:uncharacterized protein FA14DRAFT_174689 [Meira miltonrushii]|uniref:Uncharacterized protein n=1 Tax=Meira miltonrushii TaxID=1280837 RepID=A0A316VBX3_9BASI|nr:uncharacterized protein FA14DRAFT_174689 [Meira miltonrushii]PWN33055.1 hypothetical protein FA14DRAFT_174689 [Meira miltonrushii]